jgi:hypothetical protein
VELLVIAEIENQLRSIVDQAIAVIWDCPPNCDTRLKPDRVWFFQVGDKVSAIHLEIDEDGDRHEDNDERVAQLQECMNVSESWLIRYNSGATTDRPSSVTRKRLSDGNFVYQRCTGPEWDLRMTELVAKISEIHAHIVGGESPEASNWKSKLFFNA